MNPVLLGVTSLLGMAPAQADFVTQLHDWRRDRSVPLPDVK